MTPRAQILHLTTEISAERSAEIEWLRISRMDARNCKLCSVMTFAHISAKAKPRIMTTSVFFCCSALAEHMEDVYLKALKEIVERQGPLADHLDSSRRAVKQDL